MEAEPNPGPGGPGVAPAPGPGARVDNKMLIAGVEVQFPEGRVPYEQQKQLMYRVIQALQKRCNAALELPTGTGKTIALLLSVLSFKRHLERQRDQYIGNWNALIQDMFPEGIDQEQGVGPPPPPPGPPPGPPGPPGPLGPVPPPPVVPPPPPPHSQGQPHAAVAAAAAAAAATGEAAGAGGPGHQVKREAEGDAGADAALPGPGSSRSGAPKRARIVPEYPPAAQPATGPAAAGAAPALDGPPPQSLGKILFASRTHSQLRQIPRELQAAVTALGLTSIRMVTLGGQDQYCIHPDCQDLRGDARKERCADLRGAADDDEYENKLRRGAQPGQAGAAAPAVVGPEVEEEAKDRPRCHFYEGYTRLKKRMTDFGTAEIEDLGTFLGAHTTDRLMAAGLEGLTVRHYPVPDGESNAFCPYYTSKLLAKAADIIFLPYNYLIDPLMRENLSRIISLRDSVIILDEAHNIEDAAAESVTLNVTIYELKAALARLEFIKEKNWPGDENGKGRGYYPQLYPFACTIEEVLKAMIYWATARADARHVPNALGPFRAHDLLVQLREWELRAGGVGTEAMRTIDTFKYAINGIVEFQDMVNLERWSQDKGPIRGGIFFGMKLIGLFKKIHLVVDSAYRGDFGAGPGFPNPQPPYGSLERADCYMLQVLKGDQWTLHPRLAAQEGDGYDDDADRQGPGPGSQRASPLKAPGGGRMAVVVGGGDRGPVPLAILEEEPYAPDPKRKYAQGMFSDTAAALQQTRVNDLELRIRLQCLSPAVAFASLQGPQREPPPRKVPGQAAGRTPTPEFEADGEGNGLPDTLALVRSIILASGTLSPLTGLGAELGIQIPEALSTRHVISSHQVYVAIAKESTDGFQLQCSYKKRGSPDYQDALGRTVLELIKRIPGGVLLVFPSHAVKKAVLNRWGNFPEDLPIMNKMIECKSLHFEEQGLSAAQFNGVMARYREEVLRAREGGGRGRGALLACVVRGKATEGIDFKDDEARGVIMVGVPLLDTRDPYIQSKWDFNSRRSSGATGILAHTQYVSGKTWYNNQAYRAANQAIGRVIRHVSDYGAVIFLDDRYQDAVDHFRSNPNSEQLLSKWLLSALKDRRNGLQGLGRPSHVQQILAELPGFFEAAAAEFPLGGRQGEAQPAGGAGGGGGGGGGGDAGGRRVPMGGDAALPKAEEAPIPLVVGPVRYGPAAAAAAAAAAAGPLPYPAAAPRPRRPEDGDAVTEIWPSQRSAQQPGPRFSPSQATTEAVGGEAFQQRQAPSQASQAPVSPPPRAQSQAQSPGLQYARAAAMGRGTATPSPAAGPRVAAQLQTRQGPAGPRPARNYKIVTYDDDEGAPRALSPGELAQALHQARLEPLREEHGYGVGSPQPVLRGTQSPVSQAQSPYNAVPGPRPRGNANAGNSRGYSAGAGAVNSSQYVAGNIQPFAGGAAAAAAAATRDPAGWAVGSAAPTQLSPIPEGSSEAEASMARLQSQAQAPTQRPTAAGTTTRTVSYETR